MANRDRLMGVAILAILSMAIAGFALILELEGGDGARLGLIAGAPLIAAVLLAVLGGRRR